MSRKNSKELIINKRRTMSSESIDSIESRSMSIGSIDSMTLIVEKEEIKSIPIKGLIIKDNNGLKKIKELEIDYFKREVKVKGKLTKLTFSEYQILNLLIDNPGKVYTKKDLNKIIFNINEEVESRTIDTHVHNLRKKLKSSGSMINTIRSVGFIFKTD